MKSQLVAAAMLALAQVAAAAPAGTPGADTGPAAANAVAAPSTEGEVRKVDKAAGKITLKHGPIANLDMPGMTMVFRVSDPALLDKVQAGDKVRFTAEKVDGALTVVQLAPAS
ncbi:MAG: copper-binding protein [Rudaea sp.]